MEGQGIKQCQQPERNKKKKKRKKRSEAVWRRSWEAKHRKR